MAKFKVGDRVRCIYATGCEPDLIHGGEYIVEFADDHGISFDPKAEVYDWFNYRFELVEQAASGLKELPTAYAAVNGLCQLIYGSNKRAGWWSQSDNELVVPTKIALIHSELSEALEAHRKDLKDDKLPQHEGIAVELADAVIRIFDLAGFLGIPLGTIMAEKEAFNASRADHKPENRQKTGGKKY